MSAVLDRFEAEYQAYHGMSEKRRRDQLKELRAFAEFAKKDSPEKCDGQDFRAYLAHLVGLETLHVNTIRKRGNMIRPFFGWCYEAGLINGETLMAVRTVSNPNGASAQSTPKPYKPKELKRFWAELEASWPYVEEKWWRRWRRGSSKYKRIASHVMRLQIEAIVALALDCGLRRSEIFFLDIDDVHPDNEYIVVRPRTERENGKNREREVPHTEESRTHVRRWLDMRRELGVDHDRLWISAFANQAEGGWLQPMSFERFEKLLQTIGNHHPEKGDDYWRLHRFRHTCATNWLRSGMDLEVLSRLIGHAKLAQTLTYAQIVRDDIAKQVTKHEGRFQQMTGRQAVAA